MLNKDVVTVRKIGAGEPQQVEYCEGMTLGQAVEATDFNVQGCKFRVGKIDGASPETPIKPGDMVYILKAAVGND